MQKQCLIKGQKQKGRNCVSKGFKVGKAGHGLGAEEEQWVKLAGGFDEGRPSSKSMRPSGEEKQMLCGESAAGSVRVEKVVVRSSSGR